MHAWLLIALVLLGVADLAPMVSSDPVVMYDGGTIPPPKP